MNAAGETVREMSYYPFGLVNADLSSADTTGYDFLFTGKEWIDDLGIDLYDYGARYLDPELGRWGAVDPMAEKYVNHSPYNGILNNPFNGVDLFGMDVAVLGNGDISITGDDVGRYLMFLEQLGIQGRSLSYADELLQISLGFGYIPNDVYIALDGGFEIYSLIDVTCTGKNRGGGSTNRHQNLAGDWGGGATNKGDNNLGIYITETLLAAEDFYNKFGHNHTTYTTTKGLVKNIYKSNGVVRSARAGKFATASKVVKWTGIAGTVFMTSVAIYNIVDDVSNNRSVSGWDIADGSVGAIGLTGTGLSSAGIISSPVGWGVGAGVATYGWCRLWFDLGAKYGPTTWYGTNDNKWFE